jgi:hypothetical protein
MFDFNLALIDVCAAWVCVALPRMAQARLLNRWGQLGYGQEDRLRPDPVQHMSLVGTLALPAVASLFGVPVIAWGKDFDDTAPPRDLRRALTLVLATSAVFLLQAIAFALLMVVLAKVYLAGAPVAARAGQLSVRMAMLSLLAVPVLDAGIAWRYLVPWGERTKRAMIGVGATIVGLLIVSPGLQRIDGWAQLGFFYLAQLFPQV